MQFVIYNFERRMYWKENERGYSHDIKGAGLYTLDQAIEICENANIFSLEEAMLPAPKDQSTNN